MKINWLGKIIILTLLSISVGVTGCTTVVTEVAQKAWEDRSTEDQANDVKIASGILKRLSDRDAGLLLDVSTDVWERRVLLTGALDSASEKMAVEKLVRSDGRIKRLYSNIRVINKADKKKRRTQVKKKADTRNSGGVGQTVNDFWIETKIKAQLLTAKGVTSVNYRWRSVFNEVFIIGRARSSTERKKVLKTIRETEGVKTVRNYIEIKPVRK